MAAMADKTYFVTTYGCQMNEHDSERLAGMLEAEGYSKAAAPEEAEVVVFNTCCIREKADQRLYGNLGHLKPVKDANPNMKIVVGGCLAQKDKTIIQSRAPYVDVVLGTHNLGSLPRLLKEADDGPAFEIVPVVPGNVVLHLASGLALGLFLRDDGDGRVPARSSPAGSGT